MTGVAARANAPEAWDRLWTREGPASWRGERMAGVYERIAELVELCHPKVVWDLGGGVGQLATIVHERAGVRPCVVEHSQAAIDILVGQQHQCERMDIRDFEARKETDIILGTEILEHLAEEDRDALLRRCAGNRCYWSVPNNQLGPDEEPQHTIKWTAIEFLTYMRRFYERVRVECVDEYLLAVCGVPKGFTLSACTPAKDEQDDLERTLRSLRGVADDLVVGIDPRSTDLSEEIALRYADTVFTLVDPATPPDDPLYTDDPVAEGVHFAWIRNQCMDRCSGDWIFMTEAHESLVDGVAELLAFGCSTPSHVGVIFVTRSGQGQQWMFPWLSRNDTRIRYRRGTHNALTFPPGVDTRHLRQIRTSHDRSHENAKARNAQRKTQNRKFLHEDWRTRDNANSLFYLGQEWRAYDPDRAIRYFEKFLATETKHGGVRYQARLILCKLYTKAGRVADARECLLPATGDDWQRTEHWLWLGDMAYDRGQPEEALALYQLASSRWPLMPLSMFWFDTASYSYLLAQRLTMGYAATGDLDGALLWSGRVVETIPDDLERLKPEAEAVRDQIEEKIHDDQEN